MSEFKDISSAFFSKKLPSLGMVERRAHKEFMVDNKQVFYAALWQRVLSRSNQLEEVTDQHT